MLKRVLAAVFIVVAAGVTPSGARAEDWSKFYDCVRQYRQAVEQAEPSLFDGARLIVDVLCIDKSTDLGNQMIHEPTRQDIVKDQGFTGAFESFRYVMRREVTADLFKVRRDRLGF